MCGVNHRPLILIPSYNPGMRVVETVKGARRFEAPVWMVSDGSTDGSNRAVLELFGSDPFFRLLCSPHNGGKGAAVFLGLTEAHSQGFTHVLTLDADGQHPTEEIPNFIRLSKHHPDAMILGQPCFGGDAPPIRVQGRKISNAWACLETLNPKLGDSLFGFRLYPLAPLLAVMRDNRWMRGFDFDPEALVRLTWRGVPSRQIDCAVRYPSAAEGGVSHFRYGRDNLRLIFMHLRLILEMPSAVIPMCWRLAARGHGKNREEPDL